MAYKVFIDGQEGTTGLKIRGKLSGRKGIEIVEIERAFRKDRNARMEMYSEADVAIMCLPDEEAFAMVDLLDENPGMDIRLIDASSAHRVREGWTYGLPELPIQEKNCAPIKQRELIRDSRRCAVPGCHATGFVLAASPLFLAGIIPEEAQLSYLSITGFSGGGKSMIEDYKANGKGLQSPRQYALPQTHKHLPEMVKMAGLAVPPVFTPVVAAYYSGILANIPIQGEGIALDDVLSAYRYFYGSEALIRVYGATPEQEGGFLSADGMAGRDDLELFVLGCDGRFTVTLRYDNLGKGAAGAVVQCLNLMLGLEETEGLVLEGKKV